MTTVTPSELVYAARKGLAQRLGMTTAASVADLGRLMGYTGRDPGARLADYATSKRTMTPATVFALELVAAADVVLPAVYLARLKAIDAPKTPTPAETPRQAVTQVEVVEVAQKTAEINPRVAKVAFEDFARDLAQYGARLPHWRVTPNDALEGDTPDHVLAADPTPATARRLRFILFADVKAVIAAEKAGTIDA